MRPRFLPAILILLLACGSMTLAGPQCERVFAVGDLHGGYEGFVTILRETGLVDAETRWSGGNDCLVQMGDVLDRGPRSREILNLLMALESQAPGRVFALLGNHEVMVPVGDLDYTTPEEITAFAGEETPEERRRGFAAFGKERAAGGAKPVPETELRKEFDKRYPPGWFAHRRAFSPEGTYGAWLLDRPVAVKIGGTAFVHGGLTPEYAAPGVEGINRRAREELAGYFSARREMEKAGWVSALTPFRESMKRVKERAEGPGAENVPGEVRNAAEQFLAFADSSLVNAEGPVWYRGLAEGSEITLWPELEETLRDLGAHRMVVGHTTMDDGRIHVRFDGRVFLIDTGIGPAYGSHPSALELDPDGSAYAVYPGKRNLLAEPVIEDEEIEAALREGKILDMKEIGSGISRPKKVTLEYRDRRYQAAFKTISEDRVGMTRFADTGMQSRFTDSYRYEKAAYRLDRALGMHMVPVVAFRAVDGRDGAMVEWVPDAMTEATRHKNNLGPQDRRILFRQLDVMDVFDALIHNDDRHLGNLLWTTSDWRLHLIDHSRTFRLDRKLPAKFEKTPVTLPTGMFERMRELDPTSLQELIGDVISTARIKAMLARRDRIVKKFERDRKKNGPTLVFQDPENYSPPAGADASARRRAAK